MNAETLGALADIVNQAIAKAVQPLTQRIAELEGRKSVAPEDLAPLAERIKAVGAEASQRLTALEDQPATIELKADPAPAYDDTELRQELARVSENAATVYNDRPILQRLEALEAVKAYDDAPLRELVEGALAVHGKSINLLREEIKSVPTPTVTNGTDGQPGRDALDLEILPEIDQSKSYVRRTYAKHNGGLWRSFEQTHGMRGWECIVDGVHAVMPVLQGKSLTVRVIQSSGTESILMADLPIQEYKGVFAPDSDYLKHDTATWAGSLWNCNVTGTKAKPGDGSSDWTLAVKKGRDAREPVKNGGAV